MTEKYVLRNPIYLEPHDIPPEYFLWDYDSDPDGKVMEFSPEQVEELFVELDLESLTTQLDTILRNYTRSLVQETNADLSAEQLRAVSIAEVLELLGITTKEQK